MTLPLTLEQNILVVFVGSLDHREGVCCQRHQCGHLSFGDLNEYSDLDPGSIRETLVLSV